MSTKKQLRILVEARRGVVVPGAFNALSARVIVDLGFQAIYVTGAGVTNMTFALPDQAFMGLSDIADHTARIRDAEDVPLIVDADTGFGTPGDYRAFFFPTAPGDYTFQFTGTIGSSSLLYYELVHHGWPERYVGTPTAMVVFSEEFVRIPQAWAARHHNIVRWTLVDRGGHFPATEVPELFVADLRAFARELIR